MTYVDLHVITRPLSILRVIIAILVCTTFSLVASAGPFPSHYWGWCMFTWCFCFFFTLLIVILEFTTFSTKLPFAWDDFTTAFSMLASIMCLTASIVYPTFFACNICYRQIGASVLAVLCCAAYFLEVTLIRKQRAGEIRGFLSTYVGIMKMMETFLACLIFISLEASHYTKSPVLQGCVAVYSLCFILTLLIILLTVGELTPLLPFSDKIVIAYNFVAAVMYLAAMVIWPLYSFQNNKRPPDCGYLCGWDKVVMVTMMTIFNFCVYVVDSIYSLWLVCHVRTE
ncbi:myeloid-associated differentiation marker homolog [Stigmatopora argus]